MSATLRYRAMLYAPRVPECTLALLLSGAYISPELSDTIVDLLIAFSHQHRDGRIAGQYPAAFYDALYRREGLEP